MDVATVKTNPVESAASGATGSNGKTGNTTAQQLLGDFSAAVAERMKQSGYSASKQGKNTLVSSLAAETTSPVKQQPYNGPDTKPRKTTRNTVNDAPPPRRESPKQDRAAESMDARDNASAPSTNTASEAPREAAHNDQPTERSTANQQETGDDKQAASGSNDQKDAEAATADSSQTASPDDAATGDAAIIAAQQAAAILPTAQTALGDDAVGEKGKAAAEGAPQQEATTDPDATLTPDTDEGAGTEDDADAAVTQATKKSKGKAAKGSAQAVQNTAQKADGQAGGDKGTSTIQQQAADLSKKIGPDQAINVTVKTTKVADELVSQPAATLAGPALAKSEGESLTPTTAQASAKSLTPQVDSHGQPGQKGSEGQTPNQQQAQAQTAQAQAAQALAAKAAATAVDGKGAQNLDASTTSQTAKVGGGEGATPGQVTAPSGGTAQTQQAAAPKQAATAQQQNRAQVTDQVKVQIAKAISDGVDKIRIQLKPAHLGRVEVQLEISKDGRVSAVITADTKSTLDLLKQDARMLERSLQEAGLNLNSGDLSFNLRGENGQGTGDQDRAEGKAAPAGPLLEPTLDELLQTQSARPNIISKNRIDVTA